MDANEIRRIAVAFQNSRILLTAFELDIFTFLGEKRYSAEEISKELNLDKSATERLLNALVVLELLEKKNENYSNTADSFKYLSKDSPDFISALMHSNHLWDTWSHLTDVVRTGKVTYHDEINERGDEWLEAFINAMHYRGKKQAPSQVSSIDMENVNSVLDVGGGSGVFCMAFMNRKPGIKAAIFDLHNVIPISKKIVEREGVAGEIELYPGDYTVDELPKGYDLVFLSAIIHINSFEMNQELVKKCYSSLNPGGKIVIQDWIMNEEKTEPAQGALFSINMLVGTEGGNCYSEKEVSTWMRNAGFTNISKNTLEAGLGQMIGVKR